MDGPTGLPALNVSDASSWPRWKRSFELYIVAKGIHDWERKKAVLLHCGGQDLQDIYYSKPEEQTKPGTILPSDPTKEQLEEYGKEVYNLCVKVLDEHFTPKTNVVHERFLFRKMHQKSDENVEQYLVRLRGQANKCEFEDKEDQLRDQIIFTCSSEELQKQALQKSAITLDELIALAKSLEALVGAYR